ncbi:MAG: tetratricopeptide repeat protein, partial [Fimbriimonadaceae bacterium]
MKDAPGVTGSDTEVYPELAQANLLRMRREFKQAEDICLGILRRFPNNESANELLGDIMTERGDLEQAVEWYELALDIVPDSEVVKEKLAAVLKQQSETQTTQTAENLGITHTKKPPYSIIFAVAAGMIVCVLAIGAMMRQQGTQTKPPSQPLDINSSKSLEGLVNREPPKPTSTETSHNFVRHPELAKKLTEALSLPEGKLKEVESSEDKEAVRLTLVIREDEEWILRAKLVDKAFEFSPNAPSVELVIEKNFEKSANLLVERSKWEESKSDGWKQSSGGTDEALVELFFGHKIENINPPPVDDKAGDHASDPSSPPSDKG